MLSIEIFYTVKMASKIIQTALQFKEYLGQTEQYNYATDVISSHNELEYYSQNTVIKMIGGGFVYLFKSIDLKLVSKCTKYSFEL